MSFIPTSAERIMCVLNGIGLPFPGGRLSQLAPLPRSATAWVRVRVKLRARRRLPALYWSGDKRE